VDPVNVASNKWRQATGAQHGGFEHNKMTHKQDKKITSQAKSLNIEIRILISNTNGTSSRPSMETLEYLVCWVELLNKFDGFGFQYQYTNSFKIPRLITAVSSTKEKGNL
jgi:hypothetical protein